MEAILSKLEEMESPFFRRINQDLKRSRELKDGLEGLLRDARRLNARYQRTDDALPQ